MRLLNFSGLSAVAVCCVFLGLQLRSSGAAGAGASAESPTPGIERLDSTVKLTNFEPQTPFAMPGQPVPRGAEKELFAGAGGMHIGVWESGPGVLRVVNYPQDEYCVMLFGVLTVTSASGHSETFRRGDSFVIPKGFTGTWNMRTRMRKQYAIVESTSH